MSDQFKAQGLAVYPTEGVAVHALGQYLSHAELLEAVKARNPPLPVPPRSVGSSSLLDEATSLALLAERGVQVARHQLCGSEDAVHAAFIALGGTQVVVKGCTAHASHKSELGLVHLGVQDSATAVSAYRAISQAAAAAEVPLSGVIVAELVRGRRELMIGARLDPVLGAVLLVGDGGKYVEAMPDAQVMLAPFDEAKVERALRQLRMAPLLDGVRGEPPLDVASFCQMAVAVGQLMCDDAAGITQLDINPVIVGAKGQGCVAVDAVVYREDKH